MGLGKRGGGPVTGKIAAAVAGVLVVASAPMLAIVGGGVAGVGVVAAGGGMVASAIEGGGGSSGCGVSTSSAAELLEGALTPAVTRNANTIIGIGKTLGVSENGLKVAILTAYRESRVLNLANDGSWHGDPSQTDWGPKGASWAMSTAQLSMKKDNDAHGSDHDSVGLFQQRVGMWYTGSYDDSPDTIISTMMDPTYQATAYYLGSTGAGGLMSQKSLWDVSGPIDFATAKQADYNVQTYGSGAPDEEMWNKALAIYDASANAAPQPAYETIVNKAKRNGTLDKDVSTTAGSSSTACGTFSSYDLGNATGVARKILQAAYSLDGYHYQWGGGNFDGPTSGRPDDAPRNAYGAGDVGFDCSGLVQYAIYHGTDGKVNDLGRTAQLQENSFRARGWLVSGAGGSDNRPPADAKPGDIVFYGHHVAIYAGVIDGTPSLFHARYRHPNHDDDISMGPLYGPWTAWGRVGGK